MCYIACIYRMTKAVSIPTYIDLNLSTNYNNLGVFQVKNDKIVHDAMKKQVDMIFPLEIINPAKASIENCRGIGK